MGQAPIRATRDRGRPGAVAGLLRRLLGDACGAGREGRHDHAAVRSAQEVLDRLGEYLLAAGERADVRHGADQDQADVLLARTRADLVADRAARSAMKSTRTP